MESQKPEFDGPSKGTDSCFKFDIRNVPVKVDRVVFDGVQKTKNDILEMIVKPVLSATNFKEIVEKSAECKMKLEKLELFKKVDLLIDTTKGENAPADGYEVKYHVKERKYPILNVKIELGADFQKESYTVIRMKYPNIFGRGESFILDYSRVFKNDGGYSLQFSKPICGDPDIRIGAKIYKGFAEYPQSILSRGTALHLMFPSPLGSHSLNGEMVWRKQTELSLKCRIQHVFMRDTRDDTILPTKGYLLKLTQEYAPICGNVQFVKHDIALQYNLPFVLDSTIQLSLAGGILKTIGRNEDISIKNERYFLGGPLTLRGFKVNGVNQRLPVPGSNGFWLCGLHLYKPLPNIHVPGIGEIEEKFSSHCFVTAGNLGSEILNRFRLSCGLGVVLRLGGTARLEINYVKPVRYNSNCDSFEEGFQYGIGLTFS